MSNNLPKIYKSKQTFNNDVGLKIVLKFDGAGNGLLFEILSDLLNEDYEDCFKIYEYIIDRTNYTLTNDYVTYMYITVSDNDENKIEEIYQLLFQYRLEEKI